MSALSGFARSDAGHGYAELCRAYGILPHELPPPGTPERAFLIAEWQQRTEEQNDHHGPSAGQGLPNHTF